MICCLLCGSGLYAAQQVDGIANGLDVADGHDALAAYLLEGTAAWVHGGVVDDAVEDGTLVERAGSVADELHLHAADLQDDLLAP